MGLGCVIFATVWLIKRHYLKCLSSYHMILRTGGVNSFHDPMFRRWWKSFPPLSRAQWLLDKVVQWWIWGGGGKRCSKAVLSPYGDGVEGDECGRKEREKSYFASNHNHRLSEMFSTSILKTTWFFITSCDHTVPSYRLAHCSVQPVLTSTAVQELYSC
jgi:hypothetical protein